MRTKLCCIFNYPSHYRQEIYKLMENVFDCDFFFGNIAEGKIKKLDYSVFRNPIVDLKTRKIFSHFNWIKGSVGLFFKSYQKYFLVGEPYCLSTWVILFLSVFSSKKVYLWTHGWYGDEGLLKSCLKKMFFGLADGIFLYGNYAKELMIKEGFKPEKLHVIYNSLDYSLQLKIRNTLKEDSVCRNYFKNDDPVLFFSGRLTDVKRLDLLFKTQKELFDREVYFNVLLVGDGPCLPFLRKQVEEYNLKNIVWFYGACYDERIIGQFYFEADLCVSPGNVGLTAIHALMYGCPVITHDNYSKQMPEFEAIQPGITGDFFEYENVSSLANTIEKWLKDHKKKSESLKQACFRVVDEKYNPNYQMEVLKKGLE